MRSLALSVFLDSTLRFRVNRLHRCATIAQLVEQRTENPRVRGSIPRGGTICVLIVGLGLNLVI